MKGCKRTNISLNTKLAISFVSLMSPFLPELKMTNRITTRHDLENHSKQLFKIYVFIDENRLKQKIRVEIIHSD